MTKPNEKTALNSIGKRLAPPLSRLIANQYTADISRLAETCISILLGKGGGSRWAMDAEIQGALSVIRASRPLLFDVGANIGEWSMKMHQALPLARIIMFEPQPACQATIAAKAIPNAVLIPHAVSCERSVANLFTPGGTASDASLHERRDSCFQDNACSMLQVQTVRIDDIIKEYNIKYVDFLKLDIEGHELKALEGARQSLETHKIRALSFEFGSGNINSRTFFRDFYDLLHPLNYRLFRILPSARLLPIKKYYEDCEHFRGVSNYIAVLH